MGDPQVEKGGREEADVAGTVHCMCKGPEHVPFQDLKKPVWSEHGAEVRELALRQERVAGCGPLLKI